MLNTAAIVQGGSQGHRPCSLVNSDCLLSRERNLPRSSRAWPF